MTWPTRVQVIVNTLAAGISHSAPDEVRRAVTQQIAEQCRFEFGANWGWKRSAPGHPNSTDVFCTRAPFVGWDWSVPSGIAQFPESIDLTGQVFVVVEPVDHLGGTPPPIPEPPPAPIPPSVDLGRILARLDHVETLHVELGRLYLGLVTRVQAEERKPIQQHVHRLAWWTSSGPK